MWTKSIGKDKRSPANQFAIYSQLDWCRQWQFRRHLSCLGQDAVSLSLLLDFEKDLKKKPLTSYRIAEIIEEVLTWYSREGHDTHLPNRIPCDRLSEMLQIVIPFFERSYTLHRKYRDLMIKIMGAGDNLRQRDQADPGIMPEQFRLEAAKAISNLSQHWEKWDPAYLNNGAEHFLTYLAHIASKVWNVQLFTQYQFEAAKVMNRWGMWSSGEKLNKLEIIADKASNLRTFTIVFQDIVPAIGLESTAKLMAMAKDFEDFEIYFHRITKQLNYWGPGYISAFCEVKDTSELNQLIVFLKAFAANTRMAKYIFYTQVHQSGVLQTLISGSLNQHKGNVFQACMREEWKRTAEYEMIIDRLIDEFEQDIVRRYLSSIWRSAIEPHKLRWEFDKFTDYIAFEMRTQNWTVDNERNRSYWNWQDVRARELEMFTNALAPRLFQLLRQLDFSEIEVVLNLLPGYLTIEEFTKTVQVPVEWEQGIEWREGYNKWAGFYDEKVEVARPRAYIGHSFTFDRPYTQNAIGFLDNSKKIHEAIQAHKNSQR